MPKRDGPRDNHLWFDNHTGDRWWGRCETCNGGGGGICARDPNCHGWIAVNRIVVVPDGRPFDESWTKMTPDDERALRIGRAVLASEAIPSMDGFAEAYRLGWNHCRDTFLAAGDDPDE